MDIEKGEDVDIEEDVEEDMLKNGCVCPEIKLKNGWIGNKSSLFSDKGIPT